MQTGSYTLRFLNRTISLDLLKAYFTRNGGEAIN
jgi:hypothetical protein